MCDHYDKARETYVNQIIHYQFEHNYSNKKMAELLDIPISTYKNIIYRQTNNIPFDVIMRMYELNGKMMYEMTGSPPPEDIIISELYKQLPPPQRLFIKDVIVLLLNKKYLDCG